MTRTSKTIRTWLGSTAAFGLAVIVAAACSTAEAESPTVTVYKSPSCGCCSKWADHLRAEGFKVKTKEVIDLRPVKDKHGIRPGLASCHTATVGGYVIEGHVPADVIMRLLDERPDLQGLAVPGMPMGSPGMEGPVSESYDILALKKDGSTEVYESR